MLWRSGVGLVDGRWTLACNIEPSAIRFWQNMIDSNECNYAKEAIHAEYERLAAVARQVLTHDRKAHSFLLEETTFPTLSCLEKKKNENNFWAWPLRCKKQPFFPKQLLRGHSFDL